MIQTPNSSMFVEYAYDVDTWALTLRFRSTGKERRYVDVPPEVADEFESAKSKGSFYNSNIKGVFTGEDVIPPAPPVKEQLRKSVEDDLGITDADIRLAHPDYEPTPKEDDIVTPEEKATLEEPVRRQPQVEILRKEWSLVVPAQVVTAIATKEQYVEVSTRLQKKQGIRAAVFALLDPARDAVYKAYQAIQKRQKDILDPMDASIQADRGLLTAWDTKQREEAAAKQCAADAEARRVAEEQQRQRTEELRLQAAQQKVEAGDAAEAEKTLFDEDIQAPPVYIPPVRVEVETPKVEGQSFRDNWKGRVTDKEELILAVAAGIESVRKCGNLMGNPPTSIIVFSQAELNNVAKANKQLARIPGFAAENDRVLVQKKQ